MVTVLVKLLGTAFGRLTGGTLDRILDTIDHKVDDKTERDRIRADVLADYMRAQVTVLTGRGWWFPLFFIVPLGLWFAAVCLYSVLWCADCAFPQDWTVAALPSPLDEWAGAIIGSLFVAKIGETIAGRLRR
ncbi:hypothetical protein [Hoeflea prorocentri]|uniref:Holin of 3TMs, for gene-transfer release n=1 Tax=Hoeflea prorocentri TaxID=1922333 RepID=A0A9X3UGK0_9HYPH|nr:hypothetical protein [Hoeflea prorocentri]MCY6380958.1 hypothetical protein [Hoeflea prorocentri]MDA5398758.1 hypothetical protein [Hoeflea prorocentri]